MYACHHPDVERSEGPGGGDLLGGAEEHVDQAQEEGDEHGHAAGHDLRGDEEGRPGHQHEQEGGDVVAVEVPEAVPAAEIKSCMCYCTISLCESPL